MKENGNYKRDKGWKGKEKERQVKEDKSYNAIIKISTFGCRKSSNK